MTLVPNAMGIVITQATIAKARAIRERNSHRDIVGFLVGPSRSHTNVLWLDSSNVHRWANTTTGTGLHDYHNFAYIPIEAMFHTTKTSHEVW